MEKKQLRGRQLLTKEIKPKYLNDILSLPNIIVRPAMVETEHYIRCERCHYKGVKEVSRLSCDLYFCPQCIGLNRVDSNELLISLPVEKNRPTYVDFQFEFSLTKRQEIVSKELLKSYHQQKLHLVHAVTGAGKTEMLFELIKKVLSDGGRVGIAAPRVDVCLELYPRLKKVFPKVEINLLYANTKTGFTGAKFIVCTTHQLLRFYHFFDCLIIDEVDAFPFKNSEYLQYGMRQSLKKQSQLVYMSATLIPTLKAEVLESGGSQSLVSRRFHGFDLPVPKLIYVKDLSKKLGEGHLPRSISRRLMAMTQPVLIFYPSIKLMKEHFKTLTKKFPTKKIGLVYASKEDREDIVLKMRQKEWDLLLTTTILERGVTFSNISVIVMCADHRVYNKASLIQIAGRVGRDKHFPTGEVLFFHEGQTKELKQALREIKSRNKER